MTGYQTDKLWLLAVLMIGSTVFSIVTSSLLNRISAKISIKIYKDIQSDIFDKVIDADWLELSKYSNGDILNRFNGDITTVGNNAVSWLPTIIIAVYNFIATFLVLWHYDPVMALIAFISAPFMLVASKYVVRKQREYGRKTREVVSRTMSFEVETFFNIDTIKSFGIMRQYSRKMMERHYEHFARGYDHHKRYDERWRRIRNRYISSQRNTDPELRHAKAWRPSAFPFCHQGRLRNFQQGCSGVMEHIA